MKWTPSHLWISLQEGVALEGSQATVGVTSYIRNEWGEVVHLELPSLGKKVHLGEEVALVESRKAAIDIYAPLSGEIVAINTSLLSSLDLLHTSPEEGGWLFQMRISSPEEWGALLTLEEYRALFHKKDLLRN